MANGYLGGRGGCNLPQYHSACYNSYSAKGVSIRARMNRRYKSHHITGKHSSVGVVGKIPSDPICLTLRSGCMYIHTK